MRRLPIFAFLSGLLLGVTIVGLFWFAQTFARHYGPWGKAEEHFDAEASEVLKDSALRPSPAATDVYCYHEGFQDPLIYISFTDSPEYLRSIIEARTGKKIEEMATFPPSDSSIMGKFDAPGEHDKKFLTPLFDLRSIHKGVYHFGQDGNDSWYIIWDTENNRLYYRYFGT